MDEVQLSSHTTIANQPKRHSRRLVIALIVAGVLIGLSGLVAFRCIWGMYYIPSMSMAPTLVPNDRFAANMLAYRFGEPKFGDVVVFRTPLRATPGATRETVFVERVTGLPGDRIRITAGYVQVGDARYGHMNLKSALSSFAGSEPWVKLTPDGAHVGGKIVTKAQIADAVGAPGASVKIVPGVVYRNGKPLNEPYVAEDCDRPYPRPDTPSEWVRTEDGERVVVIPKGRLLVMGDNRNDSNDSRYWGLLERKRVIGQAITITYPPDRAGPIK